jgi:hypothetical protein
VAPHLFGQILPTLHWPGSEANAASSSNSLSLKESGSPLTHAVKFFVSSRSSPASMILARAPRESVLRFRLAVIRAEPPRTTAWRPLRLQGVTQFQAA